jgi:hypothetical protein
MPAESGWFAGAEVSGSAEGKNRQEDNDYRMV